MKVAAPAAATPPAAPAPDMAAPAPDMAAPAAPAPDAGGNLDFGDEAAPADDKPFDDQPFDAGVEADEDTDPKKFIEQLSGKIGQSLRKYTDETGQPDFELEKFAINSLLSATHTAEMDEDDRKDIIKKVNTAGAGESNDLEDSDMDDENDMGDDESDSEMPDMGDEENLQESEMTNLFLDGRGKRMSIYAPKGSPEYNEVHGIEEKWSEKYKKSIDCNNPKGFSQKAHCQGLKKNESIDESNNYMYWQNLKTIHDASGELLQMGQEEVDNMVANGHAWAVDHISTSADDIEEVYHFMEANMESGDDCDDYAGETEHGYEDEYGSVEHMMDEGKNKGKNKGKKLGKPMHGDVKKFKVYVKNRKGNVIKVNFGDPNMEIKRDNPKNKKSFRARHKCAQAKDRTTPKYWSCKMWSNTPVSKMVAENLTGNEKNSIFGKDLLRAKLHETFKLNDMSETVEPIVIPKTKPAPAPSRRSSPYIIEPDSVPQTDPKAITENLNKLEVYHNTFSSAVQTAGEYAKSKGYELNDDEWFNTIATGPKRPQEGQTNRYSLTLYRDGKEQRKALHIQVYGMKNKYELNTYIS